MVRIIHRPGNKDIICIWRKVLIKVQQPLIKISSRSYWNILKSIIVKFTHIVKIDAVLLMLTLSAPGGGGGGTLCSPCRFFDHCSLTGRALKPISYDFSSNFILNMWQAKLFWSLELFAHSCLFVGDCQRLLLIMILSIHCYTDLVLEIGCKFGYLIAT